MKPFVLTRLRGRLAEQVANIGVAGVPRAGAFPRLFACASGPAAVPDAPQNWRKRWCCRKGLNFRPPPYQGGALPLSYGS